MGIASRMAGRTFGAVLCAALLGGCGGGDGDGDRKAPETVEPPAASTYPVEATLQSLFTTANTRLSSTYVDPANREDYLFATEITPATHQVQFGGKGDILVNVSYLTTAVSRNGVKIWEQPGRATLFYVTSPDFLWHGQIDDEGTYSVHEPVNVLPERATLGTRGNWFTAIDYTDRSRSTVKQRTTVDYYLAAADTDGTAWLCLDFQVTEEATGARQSSATCLKTDAAGAVLQVRREGKAAL